ncbi:MAG: hypothetical protein LUQ09_05545 [Methanomassiliicoccales archaeon]|nr:hypothetical protein [Methanomassiliicoccales archaeon]
MDKVRSFNIPVLDMKGAGEFYRRVFGWEIEPVLGSGGDFHRVGTTEVDESGEPISCGAINGGLFRKGTHGIGTTFLELEVMSIDDTVAKVLQNGGALVREKRPMLDFAFFAIVQDIDGNYLGLMEYRDRKITD